MRTNRWAAVTIATTIFAVWAYVIFAPAPSLPVDVADGIYLNECCGTLQLSRGQMLVGDEPVSYRIETDKQGAYVLPDHYVGVTYDNRFQVERGAVPLKLRLDDPKYPQQIELLGTSLVYAFQRQGSTETPLP